MMMTLDHGDQFSRNDYFTSWLIQFGYTESW